MEHVKDRGTWTAVPLTTMLAHFDETYGGTDRLLGADADPVFGGP